MITFVLLLILIGMAGPVSSGADLGTVSIPAVAVGQGSGYEQCLDTLFPRPELSPQFRLTNEVVITIRANDCDIERPVTIYRDGKGQVGALTFYAEGDSIYDQLQALGKSRMNEVTPTICKQIRIASLRKSAEEVPGLIDLVTEFKKMRISPVLEPILYVHGSWFKIWVTSVANQSCFEFQFPSQPSKDDTREFPMAGWCKKVFKVLSVECDDLERKLARKRE